MPEYRTPGVYIEEISAGPRPVAASTTTETGFVGMLTLPASFHMGRGKATGMFIPGFEDRPLLTWNRGISFRGLIGADAAAGSAPSAKKKGDAPSADGAAPAPSTPKAREGSGNRLKDLVAELLQGAWEVQPPKGDDTVTITGPAGATLRFPVRRTLMSVKTLERGEKEWDLAWGADELQVVQLIAAKAVEQDIRHNGEVSSIDPSAQPLKLDLDALHDALLTGAPGVMSLDAFEQWQGDFARELFVQIAMTTRGAARAGAETAWAELPFEARAAWFRWVRHHPGMARLELSVRGFFQNGGRTAFIAMGVQAAGAAGPDKRQLLQRAFDGISAVAMVAAPGLDFAWQQAILDYAGPRGHGDLFAILDTPRYLLTREPRGVKVNAQRWTEGCAPYEMLELQTVSQPSQAELRYAEYQKDEVLDRCVARDDYGYGAAYGPWLVVENPLSTGAHDRYVIAPPAGYVAGVIAATDLKPGGGVHKAPANELVAGLAELVTSVSDREQASLNTKGINIIRHRPAAGIRIWGARTVASDPLWTYINVRRLFLFVERSVRDAIHWAVFLPNNQQTRGDLRTTIAAFLYRLYMQGMLDGATWQEAFAVRCDSDNNPDPDVRSGLLTVDVEMRPVFPAEFIRIRFRQSPMRTEVMES